ncbi:MAG TPA: hypothetical protein PKG48_12405, partial [Bacteroidales bacterium]|nr:hypothetical protein [Bacteroidales bacterium]
MKKAFSFLILMGLSHLVLSQFVAMPLNYPNDGNGYMSWWVSIADAQHAWVGTVKQAPVGGYQAFPVAVKTNDGGENWIFDTIPATGNAWIQHLAAWDANTCYYLFTDGNTGGGAVWKTSDGGSTWSKKTTTQFDGGWANFIVLFSADTALAMGDPNGGRFEIQLTNNGGNTWTRVPASDMPAAQTGEWGLSGECATAGNSVWFGTSKGRCFYSSDRGLHWSVSQVSTQYLHFCFSDPMNGFGWTAAEDVYYQTSDGGQTWTSNHNPTGSHFGYMSPVPGIVHGFVATLTQPDTTTDVIFTNDLFLTSSFIDTNISKNSTGIFFKNSSTGWMGGSYLWYHNIFKFQGELTTVQEPARLDDGMRIIPNPAFRDAVVVLPRGTDTGERWVRILDLTG